jgi:hypothetical protein
MRVSLLLNDLQLFLIFCKREKTKPRKSREFLAMSCEKNARGYWLQAAGCWKNSLDVTELLLIRCNYKCKQLLAASRWLPEWVSKK